MSSESFRPSWGRRFLLEAVHHARDLRIQNLNNGAYEVKMIGGGFLAIDFEDLMERLTKKKHLNPEILLEISREVAGEEGEKKFISWYSSFLRSDDLVWQMPLKQDQALEV